VTSVGDERPAFVRHATPEAAALALASALSQASERATRLRGRCVVVVDPSDRCVGVYNIWGANAQMRGQWPYVVALMSHKDVDELGHDAEGFDPRRLRLLDSLPIESERLLGVNPVLTAESAEHEYERAIRMALELRPTDRPVIDIAMLEWSTLVRLSRTTHHSHGGAPKLVSWSSTPNSTVQLSAHMIGRVSRVFVLGTPDIERDGSGLVGPSFPVLPRWPAAHGQEYPRFEIHEAMGNTGDAERR